MQKLEVTSYKRQATSYKRQATSYKVRATHRLDANMASLQTIHHSPVRAYGNTPLVHLYGRMAIRPLARTTVGTRMVTWHARLANRVSTRDPTNLFRVECLSLPGCCLLQRLLRGLHSYLCHLKTRCGVWHEEY